VCGVCAPVCTWRGVRTGGCTHDGRGGYFWVARAVFEHQLFRGTLFTEGEAWLWLVKEAELRTGRTTVLLQRGEFAHSLRFMGKAWGSRDSVWEVSAPV
jgi:hypothetical protein